MSYKAWELSFYEAFNEAYQSYLNNITPSIFMNTFLEKIIKITDSKSGFIGSIIEMDNKKYLSLEAINKFIICEEMSLSNNLLINIDESKLMCTHAIQINKIILTNDPHSCCDFSLTFKNCSNINSCACIPYSFNNEVVGVLVLSNRPSYSDQMIPQFIILGTLLGILQNNYFKLKKTTIDTDNRFLTYQLFEHILNVTHDGTIVTTNNFSILYINQYASNIIMNILESQQESHQESHQENHQESHQESHQENHQKNHQENHQENQEINGRNLLDIFPQLQILANKDGSNHKLYKNRKIEIKINRIANKFNCPIILEFIISSVVCHNKIYHIIMLYNHTESLLNEQKNQTNFIAFLSHELRNPLQSLSLANHLLQNTFKSEVNQSQKQYLNSISRSCSEMKKIINDILDLSKIEAYEFVIELDVYNIREIANNIVSEYKPVASEKGLDILLEINKLVPETIFTDEVRLYQILSNLMSNSIKYSKYGIVSLEITYDEIHHGILFTVIDQGDGIKKEELTNLFRQYCQTSGSDKINSNGLGLYISQKIANLLGGHISVTSEYKKGSTFKLYHPIKLGSSGTIIQKSNYKKSLEGKILLVDDNESNLVLFRLMLDNFNCEYNYSLEIHSVKDGKDAIDICRVNNYNIIFMDINMPGIDGCTASKLIKMNGSSAKIIATTGNILAKRENSTLCNSSDKYNYFDDIIIKPYDDTIILKILNKHLL